MNQKERKKERKSLKICINEFHQKKNLQNNPQYERGKENKVQKCKTYIDPI